MHGATLEDALSVLLNEGCLTLDRAPYDPNDCTPQRDQADLSCQGARKLGH